MDIHVHVHIPMDIHVHVHIPMDIHVHVHIPMDIHVHVHIPMDIHVHVHIPMDIHVHVKVIQRGGGIYGIYHTEGRRPEVDKAIDTDTLYNQLLPCTKINN